MHTPNAPPRKLFIFIDQMQCCAPLDHKQGPPNSLRKLFSRNVNDAMKDVGAGRRRRISRRLIGHWPHTGRSQQLDSSWKPLVAAEGTKGGCRRAWTACGRSWRGRDRARCRAPCNVSFVTSKRNNSTTRYVQNTLDPVFDVESDGELGSDSKLRRNGVIVTR